MVLDVEGVMDSSMGRQEALCGSRRLEPLHLPFLPTRRLVEVLGSVIPALSSLMASQQSELSLGRPV